ncbi:MAG: hypothetical protein V3R67_08805 [Thermodesulfobacteriota bacterium]
MRTVIFVGLMSIANALDDSPVDTSVEAAILGGIIMVLLVFADVVEFVRGGEK